MNPDDPNDHQRIRPYTPISPVNQKGSVTFAIKAYPKSDEYPEGGLVSQWLDSLEIGDKVTMEGPIGRMTYLGNGDWKIVSQMRKKTKIGLLAGGSGLTPHLSIMSAMHLASETICDVKLLYSNKTSSDMLCKEQLDMIDDECSNISVYQTLTREKSSDPKVLNGRVTWEMMQ